MKKFLHISEFDSVANITYKGKSLNPKLLLGYDVEISEDVKDILSDITILPKDSHTKLYFELYVGDSDSKLHPTDYVTIKHRYNNEKYSNYFYYIVVDTKLVELSAIPPASKDDVCDMVVDILNNGTSFVLFRLIKQLAHKDVLNKKDLQELFDLMDSEIDLLIKK
jgi:hypothetical protein